MHTLVLLVGGLRWHDEMARRLLGQARGLVHCLVLAPAPLPDVLLPARHMLLGEGEEACRALLCQSIGRGASIVRIPRRVCARAFRIQCPSSPHVPQQAPQQLAYALRAPHALRPSATEGVIKECPPWNHSLSVRPTVRALPLISLHPRSASIPLGPMYCTTDAPTSRCLSAP
jgi:hypothetical protein